MFDYLLREFHWWPNCLRNISPFEFRQPLSKYFEPRWRLTTFTVWLFGASEPFTDITYSGDDTVFLRFCRKSRRQFLRQALFPVPYLLHLRNWNRNIHQPARGGWIARCSIHTANLSLPQQKAIACFRHSDKEMNSIKIFVISLGDYPRRWKPCGITLDSTVDDPLRRLLTE